MEIITEEISGITLTGTNKDFIISVCLTGVGKQNDKGQMRCLPS